jgi:MoaA/NifB/PqqE/SkfB family radical SAM enzyme
MFKLARKQARQVGFTTNGTLLTEKNAQRLVGEGGDLVDISFSGNSPQTHESLRRGSKLTRLKENVHRLADVKAQANSSKPAIVLSYLLTNQSIGELPDFIRTAAEIGANEVVAINLDYTPYPVQDELRIFTCGEEANQAGEALIKEADRQARQRGLIFRRYPLQLDERVLVCDARPLDTVFINHLGEVTPCTYLGIPVSEEIPRLFCGTSRPVQPVRYGRIADGLPEVWHSVTAQQFKGPFARRQRLAGPATAFLSVADHGRPEPPAPPPQCIHCHKLYKL